MNQAIEEAWWAGFSEGSRPFTVNPIVGFVRRPKEDKPS